MKILISIFVVLTSFSTMADVGDKYTTAAKSNRISEANMLLEFTGVTVPADHDEDPLTANILVRAAVDIMGSGASDDTFNMLGMARGVKSTVVLVYDPATVIKTDKCVGKDFIYTDVNDNFGNSKTCYKFNVKDFVFK